MISRQCASELLPLTDYVEKIQMLRIHVLQIKNMNDDDEKFWEEEEFYTDKYIHLNKYSCSAECKSRRCAAFFEF